MDESDQFFSDGVHDDLLTQLAKIGSIKVISRTSVMEYTDTTKRIPEIASELGVATVVEGARCFRFCPRHPRRPAQSLTMEQMVRDSQREFCALVLDPQLYRTTAQPRRAFQGWRYLKPEDAPADRGPYQPGEEDLPTVTLDAKPLVFSLGFGYKF